MLSRPVLCTVCVLANTFPVAGNEAVPLFDGKTLDNWQSVGSAQWRVEDGVIAGGQDGDPKRSGILMTLQTYKDFDLELEFMIDEHGKYNSGVYLRHGPGERRQRGWQINIGRGAAGEFVGLHYKDWLDKGDEKDAIRKPLAWNHLRIRAVGARVEAWLNNQSIVHYTDPKPAPQLVARGAIGFQTYGAEGHAGWVKFRNIRIADLEKPLPSNSALVPVPKIEDDFYNWWKRHKTVMRVREEIDPEVVLLGDSITHLWGGKPEWEGRPAAGPRAFEATFGGMRVLNLGYGYDRIQNVLWRIDHGEIDGIRPKRVVLNIGTNNLWPTKKARGNTPEEIAEGVGAILDRLRARLPDAEIVLMGIFPRGQNPDDKSRARISATNALLARFDKREGVSYLDIGGRLLQQDGTISREVMPDYLHPAEEGYAIWGAALGEHWNRHP